MAGLYKGALREVFGDGLFLAHVSEGHHDALGRMNRSDYASFLMNAGIANQSTVVPFGAHVKSWKRILFTVFGEGEDDGDNDAASYAVGAAAGAAATGLLIYKVNKAMKDNAATKAKEVQGNAQEMKEAMEPGKEEPEDPEFPVLDPVKEEEREEIEELARVKNIAGEDTSVVEEAGGQLPTFGHEGANAILRRWGVRQANYDHWQDKAWAEGVLLKQAQKYSMQNMAVGRGNEATDDFPVLEDAPDKNFGPANEKAIGASLWGDHAASIAAGGVRAAIYSAQQAQLASHYAEQAVTKASLLSKNHCMQIHEPRGFL